MKRTALKMPKKIYLFFFPVPYSVPVSLSDMIPFCAVRAFRRKAKVRPRQPEVPVGVRISIP